MVVQTVTSIVGLPESMEVNVHPPVARDQRPTLQIGTSITIFDCDFPQHSLFAPSTHLKGGHRRMVRISTRINRTEHYFKTPRIRRERTQCLGLMGTDMENLTHTTD